MALLLRWDKVREAECVLLVALGGRVYTPTAMDLVEPFAIRVCHNFYMAQHAGNDFA